MEWARSDMNTRRVCLAARGVEVEGDLQLVRKPPWSCDWGALSVISSQDLNLHEGRGGRREVPVSEDGDRSCFGNVGSLDEDKDGAGDRGWAKDGGGRN